MTRRRTILSLLVLLAISVLGAYGFHLQQQWADAQAAPELMASYERLVVEQPSAAKPGNSIVPGEPSLAAVVKWAEAALPRVQAIGDYSCTLIKRERVGRTMVGPEYVSLKVRNRPFSVYMKYVDPPSMRNQEVIFVAGRNDGKLLTHVNGPGRLLGTIALEPNHSLVRHGNRHPITEIGLTRLVEHLIDTGRQDAKHPAAETAVSYEGGVMLNGRPCTVIEVRHPENREYFSYHLAKVYIDEQSQLPLRFEAYLWPEKPGDPPLPIEEYTYVDLKVDNGFTDREWDAANPSYGFPRGASAQRPARGSKALAREGLVAGQQ